MQRRPPPESRPATERSAARRRRTDAGAAPPGALAGIAAAAGNRAVSRLVQAKLTVGPVGDVYEREADATAKQVVGSFESAPTPAQRRGEDEELMTAPLQRQEEEEELLTAPLQRQEEEEELLMSPLQRQEEEEELMMAPVRRTAVVGMEGGPLDDATESLIQAARSGGRPLEAGLQREMEGAFGADFSSVRIHTGAQADSLNESLQSRAFTTGPDVFIRSEDYDPSSRQGKELLAHELTHVVQQGAARPR